MGFGVSGMDRYVQICKCFRDEDLRADRQPEFTQIDLEMSFITQDDVFEILEGMFGEIWKEVKGIELPVKFRRMTYDEAMKNYGSDKPDLRIKGNMKIENLSEIVKNSEFKVFQDALSVKAGVVAGIKLSGKEVTRKIIDSLTDFIKKLGFGGLGYLKYNSDGTVQSPMTKFLTEEILTGIKELFKAENGDTVFILSGENLKVLQSLGSLRLKLAEDFKLTDEQQKEFLIKDNVSGGEWDWNVLANEWESEQLNDWGLDIPQFTGIEVGTDGFTLPDAKSKADERIATLRRCPKYKKLVSLNH